MALWSFLSMMQISIAAAINCNVSLHTFVDKDPRSCRSSLSYLTDAISPWSVVVIRAIQIQQHCIKGCPRNVSRIVTRLRIVKAL